MMSEKKKKRFLAVGWANCPFPSLGHDITYCIVTRQGHQATIRPSECVLGRAVGLRYGQPHERYSTATRPACTQGRAARSRVWPGR